jgi:hypothetical protein
MRKHLVWVLAIAITATAVGVAWATEVYQVQGKIAPKKLPKKKKKPVTLTAGISHRVVEDPSARPAPSASVNLDFDKDIKLYTKGLKTCNASSISTASTATATQKCGAAKLSIGPTVPYGSGSTPKNAAVVRPAVGSDINAVVTVFNGQPQGGSPVVLLHTVNPVTGTTVLTGKVVGGPTGFGRSLAVSTPPLAGGQATIIDFTTTIKKTWKFKGKKRSFVSSSCRDKKIKFQARYVGQNGSSANSTVVQKCIQKG